MIILYELCGSLFRERAEIAVKRDHCPRIGERAHIREMMPDEHGRGADRNGLIGKPPKDRAGREVTEYRVLDVYWGPWEEKGGGKVRHYSEGGRLAEEFVDVIVRAESL